MIRYSPSWSVINLKVVLVRRIKSKLPTKPLKRAGLSRTRSTAQMPAIHIEAQEMWMAEQLCDGKPQWKIIEEAKIKFGIPHKIAKQRFEAIIERFVAEDKDQLERWKAQAIRRFFRYIERAKNELKAKPAQMHRVLQKWEDQLMKVQGTQAPIRVEHNVHIHEALIGVMTNVTESQLMDYMDQYSETTRQAQEYKLLMSTSDDAAQ